jgi:hypothetical protein
MALLHGKSIIFYMVKHHNFTPTKQQKTRTFFVLHPFLLHNKKCETRSKKFTVILREIHSYTEKKIWLSHSKKIDPYNSENWTGSVQFLDCDSLTNNNTKIVSQNYSDVD